MYSKKIYFNNLDVVNEKRKLFVMNLLSKHITFPFKVNILFLVEKDFKSAQILENIELFLLFSINITFTFLINTKICLKYFNFANVYVKTNKTLTVSDFFINVQLIRFNNFNVTIYLFLSAL